MAVLLATLVPATINRANGPGGNLVDATTAQWTLGLANAFWSARLEARSKGSDLFVGYRVVNGASVIAVTAEEEFGELDQQLISTIAAYDAVTAKLTERPTATRDSAGGGVATEVEFGASVVLERLKAIKEMRAALTHEYEAKGSDRTTVYVVSTMCGG